jgi:membrane protein YdbS with pleckstrin-like domain
MTRVTVERDAAIDDQPRARSAEPAWLTLDPRSVVAGRIAGSVPAAMVAASSLFTALMVILVRRSLVPASMIVGLGGLAVALLIAVLAWVMPRRRFRFTRYRIDDAGLVIRRGRLFRSEVAVPRSRVQHTEIAQGPLQRAFDLATLTIFTAGTAHARIDLSGVAFDEANRLRADLAGLEPGDVV